jgi:hypothetical protein
MTTSFQCSWCHEMNDRKVCWYCGHDADRPRMLCTCRYCLYRREPRP